jgi:serine/threonine protein kinase
MVRTHSYARELSHVGNHAVLGRLGNQTDVLTSVDMASGQRTIIKVTDQLNLHEAEQGMEAKIHTLCMGHPHVIELLEVVRVPTSLGRRNSTTDSTRLRLPTRERRFLDCLVMPRCPTDLSNLLARDRSGRHALPAAVAWRYGQQLLQAIAHCHSLGVVHNDIKLQNVCVDTDGAVQLIDFGLSTFAAASAAEEKANFAGTYAYMAPEVLQQRARGKASDMWSFGVCLFVMLTGKFPHRHGDLGELMADIASSTYVKVGAGVPLKKRSPMAPGGEAEDVHVLGDEHGNKECNTARLTPALIDLFTLLFAVDPAARPTAAELVQMPWFVRGGSTTTQDEYVPLLSKRDPSGITLRINSSAPLSSTAITTCTTLVTAVRTLDRSKSASTLRSSPYGSIVRAAPPQAHTTGERGANTPTMSPVFEAELNRMNKLLLLARAQHTSTHTFAEATQTIHRLASEQIVRSRSAGDLPSGSAHRLQSRPLRILPNVPSLSPKALLALVKEARTGIQSAIFDATAQLQATPAAEVVNHRPTRKARARAPKPTKAQGPPSNLAVRLKVRTASDSPSRSPPPSQKLFPSHANRKLPHARHSETIRT